MKRISPFIFSCSHPHLVACPSLQSLDEDCTLEEEDDGLIEEEDEIDQFNDDTFGAGAIGKDCANTALALVSHPGCVLQLFCHTD